MSGDRRRGSPSVHVTPGFCPVDPFQGAERAGCWALGVGTGSPRRWIPDIECLTGGQPGGAARNPHGGLAAAGHSSASSTRRVSTLLTPAGAMFRPGRRGRKPAGRPPPARAGEIQQFPQIAGSNATASGSDRASHHHAVARGERKAQCSFRCWFCGWPSHRCA